MNEPEKERILALISEGLLRPEEATSLLAALSEEHSSNLPATIAEKDKDKDASKKKDDATQPAAKPAQPLMEVQMQRADGSSYTIQVPPNLVPLFWNIAKVAIKESARTAAQETWSGFKHIVKRKTREAGEGIKSRVSSIGPKPASITAKELEPDEEGIDRTEARRQILQMVQNGRLTAVDAGKLIEQLDALDLYVKAHPIG